MSGDTNIGSEINKYIVEAENYGRLMRVKKPMFWQDESGKMHKFVKGEVRGANIGANAPQQTVFARIKMLLKETSPMNRDAKAGRYDILATFHHFDRHEISDLGRLMTSEKLTRTDEDQEKLTSEDVKIAIYFATDKTKKVALAQAFLTRTNKNKWDSKIDPLIEKLDTIKTNENELLRPDSTTIAKSIRAAFTKIGEMTSPSEIEKFIGSLIDIEMSDKSREVKNAEKRAIIQRYAQSSRVKNLEQVVKKAFDKDLQQRANQVIGGLERFRKDEGLNQELKSLEGFVRSCINYETGTPLLHDKEKWHDQMYDEATYFLSGLIADGMKLKKDEAIATFGENEGLSYASTCDLLRERAARKKADTG